MSEQADKLLSEALKLPTAERAHMAAELIASVDGEPEPNAEAAWAAEIDRRVERVQSEGAKGDDWQAVHARIAARLRSK
ncbi:MAG: addiction module protein [Myxococcales bacterium]|nr:addiction module protein [Myxococcales bacterium]